MGHTIANLRPMNMADAFILRIPAFIAPRLWGHCRVWGHRLGLRDLRDVELMLPFWGTSKLCQVSTGEP